MTGRSAGDDRQLRDGLVERLRFCLASPTPIDRVIFSMRGSCIDEP